MIIKKLKETLGQVFHSPEASGTWGDDITVNMDGGVGGSWKVECAIDEEVVDCDEMDNPPFVGVPAPAYLEYDPWFGAAPPRSEKQRDYMERETQMKQQEQAIRSEFTVESEDIHAKMYELATASQGTAVQRDPIGGSENFQGGDNGYGWMSGTGMGQFKQVEIP